MDDNQYIWEPDDETVHIRGIEWIHRVVADKHQYLLIKDGLIINTMNVDDPLWTAEDEAKFMDEWYKNPGDGTIFIGAEAAAPYTEEKITPDGIHHYHHVLTGKTWSKKEKEDEELIAAASVIESDNDEMGAKWIERPGDEIVHIRGDRMLHRVSGIMHIYLGLDENDIITSYQSISGKLWTEEDETTFQIQWYGSSGTFVSPDKQKDPNVLEKYVDDAGYWYHYYHNILSGETTKERIKKVK